MLALAALMRARRRRDAFWALSSSAAVARARRRLPLAHLTFTCRSTTASAATAHARRVDFALAVLAGLGLPSRSPGRVRGAGLVVGAMLGCRPGAGGGRAIWGPLAPERRAAAWRPRLGDGRPRQPGAVRATALAIGPPPRWCSCAPADTHPPAGVGRAANGRSRALRLVVPAAVSGRALDPRRSTRRAGPRIDRAVALRLSHRPCQSRRQRRAGEPRRARRADGQRIRSADHEPLPRRARRHDLLGRDARPCGGRHDADSRLAGGQVSGGELSESDSVPALRRRGAVRAQSAGSAAATWRDRRPAAAGTVLGHRAGVAHVAWRRAEPSRRDGIGARASARRRRRRGDVGAAGGRGAPGRQVRRSV